MDIYEQLKLISESSNSTDEEKQAAQSLYNILIKRRNMEELSSPSASDTLA